MKSAKLILVSLILLSFLIPSRFAHADVAPPPAPQLGGLEPFGYQETNVQMVYERVEMEIEPFVQFDREYTASRVYVTAYFTMHNLGDASESMQAIFPLESFSSCIGQNETSNSYTEYSIKEETFSVVVDGISIPIRKVTTDHPHKNPEAPGNMCEEMTWAGFDVTFPADEDVVIRTQYVMEPVAEDFMQNIEYVLETGAGWAGPIQRGYVIVKFPYVATTENVLSESTPGYQFLYNEVFWSFENLEPTKENNIQISIVSPGIWQRILSLKRDLKENPHLAETWSELAYTYERIARWKGGDFLRSEEYSGKVYTAYEQGILANPNNADLYAKYAHFQLYNLSPRLIRQLTEEEAATILSLLNKALALEPNNGTAKSTLSELLSVAPFVTFTPPPAIPPTETSLFTSTPSRTPIPRMTAIPSETPIIVTVVHTKIVKAPTSTPKPVPTAISSPTQVVVRDEGQNGTSTSFMIFGALVVFIAGIGAGAFWSRRTGK